MHVPPGFRVDLVAAEPDLHQPIAFAFDERGRIWVADAHSYPTRRPEGQGRGKLVIFVNRDGDGRFEGRQTFAEATLWAYSAVGRTSALPAALRAVRPAW